ncbi:hypothetical protein SteCoe_24984 [Stentor coeruleus]|uniref:Uncharacterized protein n=1 Tax=Stentor coeruleus TaxID=5963 RepID=A0A1R2BGA4_9CILI|nr:hypothetical protein SteCoe_24984 [Stentor coeruleus]
MVESISQSSYTAKLLLIGDTYVGKTCIIFRFVKNSFSLTQQTPGIDMEVKTIDIDNDKVKLQIWDTVGHAQFQTVTQIYYNGANGVIFVYDCTDEKSFSNIKEWVGKIDSLVNDDVAKVLIGNKCDNIDKKISFEQGKNLADELGICFFETSAKCDINIDNTFMYIAKEIKNKPNSNRLCDCNRFSLTSTNISKVPKGCCRR